MSRTDMILAAIQDEVERHRGKLDVDDSVRCVSLAVKVKPESGLPWLVEFGVQCVREPTGGSRHGQNSVGGARAASPNHRGDR